MFYHNKVWNQTLIVDVVWIRIEKDQQSIHATKFILFLHQQTYPLEGLVKWHYTLDVSLLLNSVLPQSIHLLKSKEGMTFSSHYQITNQIQYPVLQSSKWEWIFI